MDCSQTLASVSDRWSGYVINNWLTFSHLIKNFEIKIKYDTYVFWKQFDKKKSCCYYYKNYIFRQKKEMKSVTLYFITGTLTSEDFHQL